MTDTFKSLIGNGKVNLRITNQIFSDEIISTKNATGCIFIEIVFNRCTFDRLNFKSTAFSQCTFLASNLNAAEIYQCNFENCTFIKSDFSDSEISETSFHWCQFEETSFAQAYLENCNFQDTKFKNMDTRGLCAIIEDSKISMQGWSISFSGGFNFDKLLEFVNSI